MARWWWARGSESHVCRRGDGNKEGTALAAVSHRSTPVSSVPALFPALVIIEAWRAGRTETGFGEERKASHWHSGLTRYLVLEFCVLTARWPARVSSTTWRG